MTNGSTGASPSPTPRQVSSPERQRRIWWVMASLMMAMLLASLDQMIFGTALPTIVGELDGVDHMMWIITAYLLAETIMLPIYGKLGDVVGRKMLFIVALIIFMAGSIVGAVAHSMAALIIGRGIQGVGGGGLMILSQAIIADVVPARERGKYMGVMGGVFGLSAVLGPLLGGWFTEGPGWRWAFWINIPLGIIAIAIAAAKLQVHQPAARNVRWDWWGTVWMATSATSLILFCTWGGSRYAWGSPVILGLIGLFVLSAVLLVVVELRAEEPLVPMEFFANRNFAVVTAAGLVIGITMFGVLGYLPTYLQMVHALNATEAGYMMIPMMVSMMGFSIWTGQRITKTGTYKAYPLIGLAVVFVATLLFSTLSPATSLWTIGGYLFLLGIGLGLAMQVLVLVVQNTLPLQVVGSATAVNNFFRQIGGSIGSALVGGLFVGNLTDLLAQRMPALPAGAAAVDSNAITPQLVQQLPENIRDVVIGAYNDALTPVFFSVLPMVVIAFVLLLGVKHEKLREHTLEDELTGS